MIDDSLSKSTESTLRLHSRALGLAPGSADVFIKKSLAAAKKSLRNRKIITEKDFNRAVTKELQKYHPDLAYVFENYDKII